MDSHSLSGGRAAPPLVVDLDGTFTLTDTLWESLVRAVKRAPMTLLRLPRWLLAGRAAFKERVYETSAWKAQSVPLNTDFVHFLEEQRHKRRIVLATAAHEGVARAIAGQHPLFDDVLASDGRNNLKGAAKLKAIRERVGPHFSYAGDSLADVPIWKAADSAVLVGVSSVTRHSLPAELEVEGVFERPRAGLSTWLRAIRIHQWTKNVLLFVPLVLGLKFSLESTSQVLLAFAAFSLVASATYLVNDLWDLDSDRVHARKRHRPLASGLISIPQALAAAFLLLAGGLVLAAGLGARFLGMVVVYLVATSAYSWVLKRYMIADVVALASLYTLRIVAGAVAIDVRLTSWLLAFSVFLFLSLALIKRCAELVALESRGEHGAPGRGYSVSDLRVLWPIGASAAMSAVVVFGLFISAEETRQRFASPDLLWLTGLCLVYWISRLWIKTSRGEMHDDPVVYALQNRNSRVTIGLMLAIVVIAHFFRVL
ncbi:MAG: UbiA family prenyltransferase [Rhizobacter sp.]|nr:UbiA family prenyltransferase [Rhizobacter sp.]